jgi:hypothetical protein
MSDNHHSVAARPVARDLPTVMKGDIHMDRLRTGLALAVVLGLSGAAAAGTLEPGGTAFPVACDTTITLNDDTADKTLTLDATDGA